MKAELETDELPELVLATPTPLSELITALRPFEPAPTTSEPEPRKRLAIDLADDQWSHPGHYREDGSCLNCGLGLTIVSGEAEGNYTLREEAPAALLNHGCCICQDSGRVRVINPLGSKNFGKTQICACIFGKETNPDARFYQFSRLEPGYQNAYFEAIHSEAIRGLCFGFINDAWPPARPFMLMTGPPGTGKTFAASATMRGLWDERKQIGRFYRVIGLLKRYKATFDKDAAETVSAIDSELITAPLLLLDDLGAEKESEWTHEQLYDVIDRRYARRLPTIVTTNLSPRALEARVADRLQDVAVSTVIEFSGPSRRITP